MACRVDYHCHSSFSHDSETPMEDMVKQGIKLGIEEICFTEHKDLAPDYEWTGYYDDKKYSDTLNVLKRNYGIKIKIQKGVEVDFQSRTQKQFEKFLLDFDFDFVIASVHAVNGIFIREGFFELVSPKEAFDIYFREVESLSRLKNFSVLGHLDYIKRFNEVYYEEHLVQFMGTIENSLKNLIANKCGLELNLSGFRHGLNQPYPHKEILKMYRKLGGELISIGSDSHKPGQLGKHYEKGIEILKECGFDSFYTWEKKYPWKIRFGCDEGKLP
ncbi:MAG: histidinol-phosphatase HisJ family protein [Vulcanimicrobiota bacterium]